MAHVALASVNLIPASRQDGKHRRARTRMWCAVGLCYGGLVMLAVIFTRLLWVFDSRSLSSQLAGLMAEIENADDAAKGLRVELRNARALAETRNVVADQADWSVLLAVLSQTTGNDVVLRSVQLQTQEEREEAPAPVTATAAASSTAAATNSKTTNKSEQRVYSFAIAGLGQSQSAVSQFLLRLEQLRLFDQVRLVETRREPFLDQEAIAFRINCVLK